MFELIMNTPSISLKIKNSIKKLIGLALKKWFTFLTLIIALVGGVPGFIAIRDHFTDRPKVVISVLRIDSGSLKWPDKPTQYSYVLLESEITNEELSPILLPSKPFSLVVKIKGEWTEFEKITIPLSGTVFYRVPPDKSATNIDHMDLQKYRELNVGRLYGHYAPKIRKTEGYLNSNHFLLFISALVQPSDLKKVFKKNIVKDFPLRITWEDTRGNNYEPFIVFQDPPEITADCYKVLAQKIRYYKY